MIKFILSDNVAFLAFLLTVGAIVLFAVVLKKMLMHPEDGENEIGEEETAKEEKAKPAEESETALALIEAHLNSLSQDIAELRQQVNALSSRLESPGQDTELLKKQLSIITTKLDTISKVISELGKE